MNKTILITGASTGIGAAAARDLAPGNTVLIHYNRSEQAAGSVKADVESAGGRGLLVQADLGSEEQCARLVTEVSAHTDTLDVLINNAGGLIERSPLSDGPNWRLIDEVFRVNTFSAIYLTSALLPLLQSGSDPNVINITSIAMRNGAPTATIYGACKAALDSFTRGAARELAPHIRVNAVAPGVIETPFHQKYSTPERIQAFIEATPLKRTGNAEQIAHAIRFLVENSFVSGETIDVNGGLFMR